MEIDEIFNHYDEHFAGDAFQGKDRGFASSVSRLVPFRRMDAQTASVNTYTLTGLLKSFLGTSFDAEQRFQVWKGPADKYLDAEMIGQEDIKNVKITFEDTLQQALPLAEPDHMAQFSQYDKDARDYLVQRKVIPFPAGPILADSGGIDLTEERPLMAILQKGQPQPIEESHWYPLDPDNAIALRFSSEETYFKARRLAFELRIMIFAFLEDILSY